MASFLYIDVEWKQFSFILVDEQIKFEMRNEMSWTDRAMGIKHTLKREKSGGMNWWMSWCNLYVLLLKAFEKK